MASTPPKVIPSGAVGRFLDDVGKHRPCIFLREIDGAVLIVYGTSTAGRRYPFVLVGEREVTGRALRLTGPTYFYQPNVVSVPVDRVEVFSYGRCSPSVLLQLRALAELD